MVSEMKPVARQASRLVSGMGLALLAACSPVPHAPVLSYDGQVRPSLPSTARVATLAALPLGGESLGLLRARCHRWRPSGSFDRVPLATLDCSSSRLHQGLRHKARQIGANLLVAKRCFQWPRPAVTDSVTIECSARAAWARPELLAMAAGSEIAEPAGGDGADPVGSQPEVSFVPSPSAPVRPRPPWGAIQEVPELSVAARALGDLTARCDDCSPRALQGAIERGAQLLGADRYSIAECHREPLAGGTGLSCTSHLGVPEVDPRLDPRAR